MRSPGSGGGKVERWSYPKMANRPLFLSLSLFTSLGSRPKVSGRTVSRPQGEGGPSGAASPGLEEAGSLAGQSSPTLV